MRDPRALISTSELETLLGDPSLRVYDCTTSTVPPPPGSDVPYVAVPGLPAFEAAHIPGADFLDIQGEFSDQSTKLRFMMPPIPQLEAAFGRHGLGPGNCVVLYSSGTMWMSTRFWWMLRSLGVDAAVLEGGFEKWRTEGRPTESGKAKGYPPASFVAAPRPGLFVDKATVLAAIGQPGTVIVNALGDDLYKGTGPSRYGRPGRIPGSVQVSAATLVDPGNKGFTTLADGNYSPPRSPSV
jgi:thiosulfate/3-mercaptopyruvate sulfurtransferase